LSRFGQFAKPSAGRRTDVVFVCYSHEDEKWRRRFEIITTPLSKKERIRFWSDRNINYGKWEKQLEHAMRESVAAVFLVSDDFLASNYIMSKEVPYLLRANRKRGLMIFWIYLEPCDLACCPEITQFQAITLGTLDPLSMLPEWKRRATMVKGCRLIEAFLKRLERPAINPAVSRKRFPKISDKVPLLARPTRRDVEVLVYAGEKWWRQWRMKAGATKTKIQLGNDQTKKGAEFEVIALTTETPLTKQTYARLPAHRTKSDKVILIRT
jgi:hypothetical protein